MDELWKRVRIFSRRSAAGMPDERWSPEWLEEIGRFWQQAREQSGLSRQDIAQRLDVTLNEVRFLEYGLATPSELKKGWVTRYAEALGEPALDTAFREQFGL